jgi:hypothetical protein
MYEADLTKADVIFDMLVEDVNNMKKLYSQKIRKGTRCYQRINHRLI